MKRQLIILPLAATVLGFCAQARAGLSDRGVDSLGYHLIYDDDLNITWYDFTNAATTWGNQMNWAAALSVNFNGTPYDDWRLPTTVDGANVWGYDGTTTAGYNITSSEMGHLYYAELGNKGWFAVDGTLPQPGWGLANRGPFHNLLDNAYWSGTEYSLDPIGAWDFTFHSGSQGYDYKSLEFYALAVRPGDVVSRTSPIPAPGALLLGALGAGVVGWLRGRRTL